MYPDGRSLAYKVDHVGVSVALAEPAFEFCRDNLGLPVAWPFADYGPVRTGGVGLGNLNLEILEPSPLLSPRDPAAIGLVAFQPAPSSMEELVAGLAHRGVGYQDPLTIVEGIFGFTVVPIPKPGVNLAFFCAYHYPGSHDNAVRTAELSAVGGGTLGLQGVTELRAAVDVEACTAILGPPTGTTWPFDTGPDLVADTSASAGSARMTWSVRDVAAAEQALIDLGAQRTGGVFSIPQVGGLAVSLAPSSPARPARLAERRFAESVSSDHAVTSAPGRASRGPRRQARPGRRHGLGRRPGQQIGRKAASGRTGRLWAWPFANKYAGVTSV